MSAVCRTCHDPVVVASKPDEYPTRWAHDGEPGDHKVEPQPLCPKCGSLDFSHYQTNWGNGWRCAGCGHDEYYSIGD